MLDHILIESTPEGYNAFEVEHTGQRYQVFWLYTGTIERLQRRIRWEYRKRFNRGTLVIKFNDNSSTDAELIARFELWARTKGMLIDKQGDSYKSLETVAYWDTWCAAQPSGEERL